jgi:hypothetical protein
LPAKFVISSRRRRVEPKILRVMRVPANATKTAKCAPADGRLRCQRGAALRTAADGEFQQRIHAAQLCDQRRARTIVESAAGVAGVLFEARDRGGEQLIVGLHTASNGEGYG